MTCIDKGWVGVVLGVCVFFLTAGSRVVVQAPRIVFWSWNGSSFISMHVRQYRKAAGLIHLTDVLHWTFNLDKWCVVSFFALPVGRFPLSRFDDYHCRIYHWGLHLVFFIEFQLFSLWRDFYSVPSTHFMWF